MLQRVFICQVSLFDGDYFCYESDTKNSVFPGEKALFYPLDDAIISYSVISKHLAAQYALDVCIEVRDRLNETIEKLDKED